MILPDDCEDKEWIIPTRTGGYSSSTVCGVNSRTYHGFLVVPQNPPHFRFLILSKFEDFLRLGKEEVPLNTNHYVGGFYPDGYKFITRFERGSNYVRWYYEYGTVDVEKTLVVNKFYNAVDITYKSTKGTFRVCPLLTYRSHHLTWKSGRGFFMMETQGDRINILFENKRILTMEIEGDNKIEPTGYWYYNFMYKLDKENGSNYQEDLYNPFCVYSSSNQLVIHAYSGERPSPMPLKVMHRDPVKLLGESSLDFLVKGDKGWALIAGYHWFDEWGRDTFVSMEGALLMNGGTKEASDIIKRYFLEEEKGMLPNSFIDYNGEPVYRGVDVSLWGINAVYRYYTYTHDKDLVKQVFDKMEDVIEWYGKGNGIVYNKEGLIFHRGAPRTWMDAQYDGVIVTPREGAAVEVNALWYNALMEMDFLSKILEQGDERYVQMAEKTKESFLSAFRGENYLHDVIDWEGRPDRSLRPNQILAVSLPFPIVEGDLAKKVVNAVEDSLFRPYGLSSLSRNSPDYRPVYKGDRASRDSAYHNGPIWPWLLGSFIDAKIRIESNQIMLKLLIDQLRPLLSLAEKNGGYLPEIFDDVPPYKPRGCIAQAWSNAEVYRGINKLIKL